jgi:hypothetical protein
VPRTLVEDCISIDVTRIRRLIEATPLCRLRWSGVNFTVEYRWDGRSLFLSYPSGQQQRLRLTAYATHNGGSRLLFDLGNRRCEKLYLPPGGDVFRSRQALRLRYQSQTLGKRPRERLRAERILSRIGPAGPAVKRNGLRRRQWERMVARLEMLHPSNPG